MTARETKIMLDPIKRFLADESGATAIEYALLSALIALALVASLNLLDTKLQNTFNEVASNLN